METWQYEPFLQELTRRRGQTVARIAQAVLEWGAEKGRLEPQTERGRDHTGYVVVLPRQAADVTLFKLAVSGKIQWYSGYGGYALTMLPFTTTAAQSEFVVRFRKSGASVSSDDFEPKNERSNGPQIDVSDVTDLSAFIRALDWVVERMNHVSGDSA